MTEAGLTSEEKRCLQLWFRQAIAKLEQDEVTSELVRRHGLSNETGLHRPHVTRRRSRRLRQTLHPSKVTV